MQLEEISRIGVYITCKAIDRSSDQKMDTASDEVNKLHVQKASANT